MEIKHVSLDYQKLLKEVSFNKVSTTS